MGVITGVITRTSFSLGSFQHPLLVPKMQSARRNVDGPVFIKVLYVLARSFTSYRRVCHSCLVRLDNVVDVSSSGLEHSKVRTFLVPVGGR